MNKNEKFVVTINRELGSGGRTVGRILAEKLGVPYYDKALTKPLEEKFNLSLDQIEQLKGNNRSWWKEIKRVLILGEEAANSSEYYDEEKKSSTISRTGIARDELAAKLRASGFDVIMAKRTDKAHLKERQEEKLDKQPDMYVSLHCNSAAGDAKGEEVCFREDADKTFATTIKDALAKDKTIDTRKKPLLSGKFMVLGGDKDNRTAECLVEMGFMSGDYAKLTDATTRGQQLDAIADGIKNHYNANKAK